MELLTDTSREGLEFVYDRISSFIPFEECSNNCRDKNGERYKDKEYLICLSTDGTEIKAYAPIAGSSQHREVGYVQFVPEKVGGRKNMKIWFLTVEADYNGLGIGSMLMAGVKHICMEKNISTLTLDAARRYKEKTASSVLRHPETKDDGHYMYNANLALYREMGFEIDKKSDTYTHNMEDNFLDNAPIPMVCRLDGVISPASYQKAHQKTFESNIKESDQGLGFTL